MLCFLGVFNFSWYKTGIGTLDAFKDSNFFLYLIFSNLLMFTLPFKVMDVGNNGQYCIIYLRNEKINNI